MSIRAVYVLTSEGCDIYSAMTRLSAASLRITNPGSTIIVTCDAYSFAAMKGCRDPLLDEADNCLVFETPTGDAVFRNRFIKTNLRNLIDGPYLFLDSDTLIRGDLSSLLQLSADIALAANHSKARVQDQIWQEDQAEITAMGWQSRSDVYVNGGLMACNNTPSAYRFATDWHRRWLASHARLKRNRDQPALNAAILATGVELEILPHRFNAQIKVSPETAANAVIWHFYSANGTAPITAFELLAVEVMNGRNFGHFEIETMIGQRHPWRRASWMDDVAAEFISRKRHLDRNDYSWFEGRRLKSVAGRAHDFLRSKLTAPIR